MLKFIKRILKFKNEHKQYPDPLRCCDYYRKNGCSHVDGMFCPCEEMVSVSK